MWLTQPLHTAKVQAALTDPTLWKLHTHTGWKSYLGNENATVEQEEVVEEEERNEETGNHTDSSLYQFAAITDLQRAI